MQVFTEAGVVPEEIEEKIVAVKPELRTHVSDVGVGVGTLMHAKNKFKSLQRAGGEDKLTLKDLFKGYTQQQLDIGQLKATVDELQANAQNQAAGGQSLHSRIEALKATNGAQAETIAQLVADVKLLGKRTSLPLAKEVKADYDKRNEKQIPLAEHGCRVRGL